ncbi:hypothetical protein [Spiroplasma endosymbiont of Polydrusus formosus]|uniref:hypothetical protein n=1 Tax=Spiroplasma endosymbiont of Polydrusus formosus TaxID=3139326 RepID=UPI0035B53C05
MSNLNFIETKAIKIFSKPNKKILLPFYNYHEEKPNISEKEIIYNSPDDEISEEISKSIEIQKGLSTTSGKTKSQTTTNSHNFNIGLSVSGEAETKIFGIGAKITTTINTEYGYSNENSESIEVTLENSFNSSNTRKEEKKEVNKKTIKSQSIIILPKKKLIYNSKIYKYSCEDFWNLTKKFNGLISALIIDENNNSEILNASIKDIMQSLKENDILPEEFKINQQDNSITWTRKMATKYTCGFEQDSSSETKLVDV